jgi:beta-alanine degradation protein BauB
MDMKTKTKTSSVSTPVTELKYGPTGLTDGEHGELAAAPAYGDLANGPHSTFIKMPAGYVSPTHTHSDDYWAVVVSGVMVNKMPDGADIPLPVGSYFLQKGGEPHVTKCISPNECIFFVRQNGKFDYHE